MKIATGIPGFDKLISGGFEENTVNLVAGETGTCKSIFCMQFLYNRAKKFKEDICYITTQDGVMPVIKQAEQFGWKLKKPPLKNRFHIITLEPYKVNMLMKTIEDVRKNKINIVAIDSISVFESYVKESFVVRKSLFSIIERLRQGGRVTLMTAEIPGGSEGLSRSEVVEFMADSVIRMQYIQEAKMKRSLLVKKMRFSSHAETAHPFHITKKGIVVR